MGAAYTLALAVLLLTGGRLGDMFGRKRMLTIGIGGFTFASLSCAVAQSPDMLIGSRVLQGVFGALMLPQGFGLMKDLFPPSEMGKVWGMFGPVMGLSAVLGPIVGGTLVDVDLLGSGWRSIFLVNLPIGIAVLGTIFFGVVGVEHGARVFVDAAEQTTLVTIALVALAFAVGFQLPRKPRAEEHAADGSAPAATAGPAYA